MNKNLNTIINNEKNYFNISNILQVYFVFPNIRYFLTSVNVVRGKYDEIEKDGDDSKDGEVSHFQALTTEKDIIIIKVKTMYLSLFIYFVSIFNPIYKPPL